MPKASKKEKNAGLGAVHEKIVSDGRKKPIDNPFQRGSTPRKNQHPTVKPIKLMSYLITMGSRENDVVLDPYCGAGSSCIAAKLLNRPYIGIEISPEYHEIAVQRIDSVKATKHGGTSKISEIPTAGQVDDRRVVSKTKATKGKIVVIKPPADEKLRMAA